MNQQERHLFSFTMAMASMIFIYMFVEFNKTFSSVEIKTSEEIAIPIEVIHIPEIEEEKKSEISNDELKNNTNNLLSKKSDNTFESKKTDQEIYNNVKNYEQQLFSEFHTEKKTSDSKNNFVVSEKKETPKKNISSQTIGNVMVEFKVDERNAFNNNLWFVRNPGYTCGFNSNGLVHIDIVVDNFGNVVQTKFNEEKSKNYNDCMIQQSLIYAKKSKFTEGTKKQTGFIRYKFESQ